MKLLSTSTIAAILAAVSLEIQAQVDGPGTALSLNGANGYATVTNASVFNFSGAFTVEAWINVTALNSQWQAIVTKGDSAWRLHRYNYTSVISFGTSGLSDVDLAGVTAVDDGKWHHVAGVYDGANKYLYVDGALDASTNVTGTLGTDSYPLDIGENAEQTGRVWNGAIDEVRIWDIARSQAQIQINMHRNLTGAEPGLLAYYRLDDLGAVINNSTGNAGEDGALVGEATLQPSTAPIGLPAIAITGLTALNGKAATLGGSIAGNFQQTGWYYQYGTSSNYDSMTPVTIISANTGQGNAPIDASQALGGLAPGTVYYFRLVATNTAGMNASADQAFTTSPTSLSTLYSFSGMSYQNSSPFNFNSDGAYPGARLIISGNTLYGTASRAGVAGYGTIFALNTDGTGFTNLHSLAYNDGINPFKGLALSSSTLYGSAWQGGALGGGTVFALGTDGTGFTVLHNFSLTSGSSETNADGFGVIGDLFVSGAALYGTAEEGGNYGGGALFALSTNGTAFTNLYDFNNSVTNDAGFPASGPILAGHTLYGTTRIGGASFDGSVFAINTDGTGLTNLYSFTETLGQAGAFGSGTNADGSEPVADLVLSGNTLYGTTLNGGLFGSGTVFRVNIDGTGYTNLHSFTSLNSFQTRAINSDGANPQAGLILVGNTLYGVTQLGGVLGAGCVFAINTDGSGFANLHSFGGNDGAGPVGGLVVSGNTLYGTTLSGGNGTGTVFALPLGIPLVVQRGDNSVILSWSNPAFSLQSAPTPNGVFTNVPGATSPYTQPLDAPAQFFRLKAN